MKRTKIDDNVLEMLNFSYCRVSKNIRFDIMQNITLIVAGIGAFGLGVSGRWQRCGGRAATAPHPKRHPNRCCRPFNSWRLRERGSATFDSRPGSQIVILGKNQDPADVPVGLCFELGYVF